MSGAEGQTGGTAVATASPSSLQIFIAAHARGLKRGYDVLKGGGNVARLSVDALAALLAPRVCDARTARALAADIAAADSAGGNGLSLRGFIAALCRASALGGSDAGDDDVGRLQALLDAVDPSGALFTERTERAHSAGAAGAAQATGPASGPAPPPPPPLAPQRPPPPVQAPAPLLSLPSDWRASWVQSTADVDAYLRRVREAAPPPSPGAAADTAADGGGSGGGFVDPPARRRPPSGASQSATGAPGAVHLSLSELEVPATASHSAGGAAAAASLPSPPSPGSGVGSDHPPQRQPPAGPARWASTITAIRGAASSASDVLLSSTVTAAAEAAAQPSARSAGGPSLTSTPARPARAAHRRPEMMTPISLALQRAAVSLGHVGGFLGGPSPGGTPARVGSLPAEQYGSAFPSAAAPPLVAPVAALPAPAAAHFAQAAAARAALVARIIQRRQLDEDGGDPVAIAAAAAAAAVVSAAPPSLDDGAPLFPASPLAKTLRRLDGGATQRLAAGAGGTVSLAGPPSVPAAAADGDDRDFASVNVSGAEHVLHLLFARYACGPVDAKRRTPMLVTAEPPAAAPASRPPLLSSAAFSRLVADAGIVDGEQLVRGDVAVVYAAALARSAPSGSDAPAPAAAAAAGATSRAPPRPPGLDFAAFCHALSLAADKRYGGGPQPQPWLLGDVAASALPSNWLTAADALRRLVVRHAAPLAVSLGLVETVDVVCFPAPESAPLTSGSGSAGASVGSGTGVQPAEQQPPAVASLRRASKPAGAQPRQLPQARRPVPAAYAQQPALLAPAPARVAAPVMTPAPETDDGGDALPSSADSSFAAPAPPPLPRVVTAALPPSSTVPPSTTVAAVPPPPSTSPDGRRPQPSPSRLPIRAPASPSRVPGRDASGAAAMPLPSATTPPFQQQQQQQQQLQPPPSQPARQRSRPPPPLQVDVAPPSPARSSSARAARSPSRHRLLYASASSSTAAATSAAARSVLPSNQSSPTRGSVAPRPTAAAATRTSTATASTAASRGRLTAKPPQPPRDASTVVAPHQPGAPVGGTHRARSASSSRAGSAPPLVPATAPVRHGYGALLLREVVLQQRDQEQQQPPGGGSGSVGAGRPRSGSAAAPSLSPASARLVFQRALAASGLCAVNALGGAAMGAPVVLTAVADALNTTVSGVSRAGVTLPAVAAAATSQAAWQRAPASSPAQLLLPGTTAVSPAPPPSRARAAGEGLVVPYPPPSATKAPAPAASSDGAVSRSPAQAASEAAAVHLPPSHNASLASVASTTGGGIGDGSASLHTYTESLSLLLDEAATAAPAADTSVASAGGPPPTAAASTPTLHRHAAPATPLTTTAHDGGDGHRRRAVAWGSGVVSRSGLPAAASPASTDAAAAVGGEGALAVSTPLARQPQRSALPTTDRKQREWQRRLLMGGAIDGSGGGSDETTSGAEASSPAAGQPSPPADEGHSYRSPSPGFTSPGQARRHRRSVSRLSASAAGSGGGGDDRAAGVGVGDANSRDTDEDVDEDDGGARTQLDRSLARTLAEAGDERNHGHGSDGSDAYSIVSGGPAVTPGAKIAVPRRRHHRRDDAPTPSLPAAAAAPVATSAVLSVASPPPAPAATPAVRIRITAAGIEIIGGSGGTTGEGVDGTGVMMLAQSLHELTGNGGNEAASADAATPQQPGSGSSPRPRSAVMAAASPSAAAAALVVGSSALPTHPATTVRVHRSGSLEVTAGAAPAPPLPAPLELSAAAAPPSRPEPPSAHPHQVDLSLQSPLPEGGWVADTAAAGMPPPSPPLDGGDAAGDAAR